MTRDASRMPVLSSRHHPVAALVRKIARRPAAGRRQGFFVLDGVHLIEEALAAACLPEQIIVSPRLLQSSQGRRLIPLLEQRGWPLVQASSDSLLDSLAATDSPQGILGLFRRRAGAPGAQLAAIAEPAGPRSLPAKAAEARGPRLAALVLAGLQDPGNLGALARAAWVFGCAGLITLERTVDPYHPRALRASSGAILRLSVATDVTAADLQLWARSRDVQLAVLAPRGGTPLTGFRSAARGLAIVLGSEGHGPPQDVEALCSARLTIPMQAAAESLGVAAAGSIALYALSAAGAAPAPVPPRRDAERGA